MPRTGKIAKTIRHRIMHELVKQKLIRGKRAHAGRESPVERVRHIHAQLLTGKSDHLCFR